MANQNSPTSTTNESSEQTASPAPSRATPSGKTQREVDEQAEQTFPASDAPAGWAGKDIAPQDRKDAQKNG